MLALAAKGACVAASSSVVVFIYSLIIFSLAENLKRRLRGLAKGQT